MLVLSLRGLGNQDLSHDILILMAYDMR
jgi:hypothetical protein